MKILRSTKELTGPALHVPSLAFYAWYEVLHGPQAWQALHKISTEAVIFPRSVLAH